VVVFTIFLNKKLKKNIYLFFKKKYLFFLFKIASTHLLSFFAPLSFFKKKMKRTINYVSDSEDEDKTILPRGNNLMIKINQSSFCMDQPIDTFEFFTFDVKKIVDHQGSQVILEPKAKEDASLLVDMDVVSIANYKAKRRFERMYTHFVFLKKKESDFVSACDAISKGRLRRSELQLVETVEKLELVRKQIDKEKKSLLNEQTKYRDFFTKYFEGPSDILDLVIQ
jgi:hypothetical protein